MPRRWSDFAGQSASPSTSTERDAAMRPQLPIGCPADLDPDGERFELVEPPTAE